MGPNSSRVELRRALEFDEVRRDEAAVRVRLVEAARLDDARFVAHALDVPIQAIPGRSRDDRAHVGREFGRIADDEFVHGAHDHFQNRIGDLLLQEQQPQRRAALTRAHESGTHHIVDHLLRQSGRIDQHGVQAAGLGDQRHDRAAARGQAAIDGKSSRRRAGHGDSRERAM